VIITIALLLSIPPRAFLSSLCFCGLTIVSGGQPGVSHDKSQR